MSGCLGPQVNTCLTDLNIIDEAIKQLPENASKADIIKVIHDTPIQYCVPPSEAEDQEPFYRKNVTGDHVYDAFDWGILMNWIQDHKK